MVNYCAALFTDGQMNLTDIRRECTSMKFSPILLFSYKGEDEIYIPLFTKAEIAVKFSKRNIPDQKPPGAVNLTEDDYDFIKEQKWKHFILKFPRKITDLVDFSVGILEYDTSPIVQRIGTLNEVF